MTDETKNEGQIDEEQGYNDQELKDIMSEIEDLEKDLEVVAPDMLSTEDEDEDEAEHVIEDAGPDMEKSPDMEETAEPSQEEIPESAHEENVVSLEEVKTQAVEPAAKVENHPSSPFGLSFEGEGNYNFKMNFPVGEKTVHFEVHPDNTFKLDFDNVKFSVTADSCVVHLDGGATFNLPLTKRHSDKVKKAS